MSLTSVDRLGYRLKLGQISDEDLRLQDQYRRSFAPAYEVVIETVRRFGYQPTGRPAKSTPSIVSKLGRESIRLTQMQDIAGCRLVVSNTLEQDSVLVTLQEALPSQATYDRRIRPSHGYRAVHLVASVENKLVEVQLRTELQHLWAELSEKLSDYYGPEIKYGAGEEVALRMLDAFSVAIDTIESFDSEPALPGKVVQIRSEVQEKLRIAIRDLTQRRGG